MYGVEKSPFIGFPPHCICCGCIWLQLLFAMSEQSAGDNAAAAAVTSTLMIDIQRDRIFGWCFYLKKKVRIQKKICLGFLVIVGVGVLFVLIGLNWFFVVWVLKL